MADYPLIDMPEVKLEKIRYCAECMTPMQISSANSFVCGNCGFQYSEK